MLLIGVVEKKGEFQGNQYHNIALHTVVDSDNSVSWGQITEVVKIKYSKLRECFGKTTDLTDVINLIGCDLAFGYDKFGNVNQVRIIEDDRDSGNSGVTETA